MVFIAAGAANWTVEISSIVLVVVEAGWRVLKGSAAAIPEHLVGISTYADVVVVSEEASFAGG